ncbi:carbamoyltransferase HypF [Methylomagnum ishizawai]|uniref:carbamoyltransferase HypF n=1 Tax=Methylomagnum ishizawai TaxID=1760988 RepID=UPI001C32FA12|nr:carbamoyltransferase HypF [Methylomagnum ishizawai]BBL76391.1 carbamoyltransferase HypF [Methylomagnum ishizawai]
MTGILAQRILVTGRVQGVGFRPFVSRIAQEYGLAGWVLNRGGRVDIRVEGSAPALEAFGRALIERAPPLARPDPPRVTVVEPQGLQGFAIQHSATDPRADVHLPPDYFVCDDCLAEMRDPAQRRYRYPFINCTQCGPRYTLIERLPYDRPHTALAGFPLCPDCLAEYSDPADRRYHAQPLACARCGPGLVFRQPGQGDSVGDEAALAACLGALRAGLIVAVKGVGGYHLLCDALDPGPVLRLRERKHRPHKPLAVLLPWQGGDGLDWARRVAEPTAEEREALRSPLRPIVLVRKRMDSPLAGAVAPGLDEVGLMLPYSPLHHLLAEGYGAPLVATSANLSGEPVLTEAAEVEARLGRVADAFLHHNRPILRPADDSVFRRVAGRVRPIRCGRGLAPQEIALPFRLERPLLAVGADLKNTVALAFDDRVVVSPHIGDLGTVRSAEVFGRVVADLSALYGVEPALIVHDAHPGYRSARWAQARNLPCWPVFHHHAHASALAGECGWLDGPSLVFAWDGTGYGEDGTVWGGEALLGAPGAWRRVGSLRRFRLPGGDKASREAWRCALALCWETGRDWPERPKDSGLLRQAWERGLNCPSASSAGRLFDAAAALIGVALESSYEGHAAMRLETLARPGAEPMPLALARNAGGVWISDWAGWLPMLMDTGLAPAERASIFHASLARLIAGQAEALRAEHGVDRVGLSGGVFQNRLLTELAVAELTGRGFVVGLHRDIPAGDGGISYGQVIEVGRRASSPRSPDS